MKYWDAMHMRMATLLLVLGLTVGPVRASDDLRPLTQDVPPDKHGAVMCVWMITVSIKAIGEVCYKERDAAFMDALDWSLAEIESFIIRNSAITTEQIMKGRARYRDDIVKRAAADREAICVPGFNSIYPAPDRIPSRQSIEERTHKLLAIERPPVWNPCL